MNDQGLVTVHPACNGIVTIYSDSDRARLAKGALDTLALGPLGLLIASSTRGMRAECTGCGKVFIRSAASAVIINKINLLLERGELVHRAYTPPPVLKYDPNEVHTTKAVKSQKVDQVIDSKVNSIRTSIRTIFACAILWSMFTGGAMAICEAWAWDFWHIVGVIICGAIALLMLLACLAAVVGLFKKPTSPVKSDKPS